MCGSCKGCLLRRLILVSSLWKKSDQFNLSDLPTHPSTHRPKSLFVIYLYPLSLPDLSKGPEVVNKCKFSIYLTCKTFAIISNTLDGKSGLCTSEILDKHPTLFSSIFSGNNQSTTNTAPAQFSCVTTLCVVFIRNIGICGNHASPSTGG